MLLLESAWDCVGELLRRGRHKGLQRPLGQQLAHSCRVQQVLHAVLQVYARRVCRPRGKELVVFFHCSMDGSSVGSCMQGFTLKDLLGAVCYLLSLHGEV